MIFIFTLAALTSNISVAPKARLLQSCDQSHWSVGNSVPGLWFYDESRVVTNIRKLVDHSGYRVGWIYYTRPGTLFVQATSQMTQKDRDTIKPWVISSHGASGDSLETAGGERVSAIVPIRKVPWTDLHIVSCTEHEWSHRIFNH
jgi:hypothetical protein